jgi:hypothetical protein
MLHLLTQAPRGWNESITLIGSKLAPGPPAGLVRLTSFLDFFALLCKLSLPDNLLIPPPRGLSQDKAKQLILEEEIAKNRHTSQTIYFYRNNIC